MLKVSQRFLADFGLRSAGDYLVTNIPARTGAYTPDRTAYKIKICRRSCSAKPTRYDA
jgi:hypothetical protein